MDARSHTFANFGHLALLIAVPTLAGLVVAGCGDGDAREETLTLNTRLGDVAFVDTPPRSQQSGPRASVSAGDVLASRDTVVDAEGKEIGALHTSCIATSSGETLLDGAYNCSGVFELDDGEIVIEAVAHPSQRTEVLAVTGGTEAYEGVTGSDTSTIRGNRGSDELHLFFPEDDE